MSEGVRRRGGGSHRPPLVPPRAGDRDQRGGGPRHPFQQEELQRSPRGRERGGLVSVNERRVRRETDMKPTLGILLMAATLLLLAGQRPVATQPDGTPSPTGLWCPRNRPGNSVHGGRRRPAATELGKSGWCFRAACSLPCSYRLRNAGCAGAGAEKPFPSNRMTYFSAMSTVVSRDGDEPGPIFR